MCTVSFQASYVWGKALIAMPSLSSPGDWGWKNDTDGKLTPSWTILSEASKECWEATRPTGIVSAIVVNKEIINSYIMLC